MALKDDISRGNYLIMQHPFQIEAWAYPFRFVPIRDETGAVKEFPTQQPYPLTTLTEGIVGNYLEAKLPNQNWVYYQVLEDFDLDLFSKSGFTSFMNPGYTLDLFPEGSENLKFSPLIQVGRDLTALEAANVQNIFRIQWHDDDLHPNNSLVNASGQVFTVPGAVGPFDSLEPPSIIGLGRDYFAAKKADPVFDNVLMSIDMPPYGYTIPEQLDTYMSTLDTDLVFFNRYPWIDDEAFHYRQQEYGMYAVLIYHRQVALDGTDRTGNLPLPFGGFLQTCYQNKDTVMPYAYRKYQAFLYLTFGAKALSAFVYNDYPNDASIGAISYLFDQEGTPKTEDPQPTSEFYKQAVINKKISILGNTLRFLHTTGQRLIRATNIENFVQSDGFAGGIYDWDYGVRPDTRLSNIIVSRDDAETTQDVWVGYFNPMHSSLDGSGTTDETYFMICNGSWSLDDTLNIKQRIRMEFDFGVDDSIKNLIKLSHKTGSLEVIPLINTGGNTYYYEHVLDAGEADLFKYDTTVKFLGDPLPQVESQTLTEPPFNYPGGFRVSNGDPIDAERYIQNNIAERDLLVIQGRAKEGQQCYVKNIGDNSSELFILKGPSNADWVPTWKSPNQIADMYKQTYDTNDSGVVDNAELLSGRQLNEENVPETVVSRDASGDIKARLLKSSFPDGLSIADTGTVIMRNSNASNNDFLRPITKSAFWIWLNFNKETIDNFGINAVKLSGRNLDYAARPDTVAGRNDVDGAISANIFRLTNWDLKQIGGVLVFSNAALGIQLQFPTDRTGVVAFENVPDGSPPASPTSPGVYGTVVWTQTHLYRCIATNTWRRIPLETWI